MTGLLPAYKVASVVAFSPGGGQLPNWRYSAPSFDDFTADSDVDVVVSFDPAATWSLWDLTTMADELSAIVGRRVDLVEKEGLRTYFGDSSSLRPEDHSCPGRKMTAFICGTCWPPHGR